MLKLSYSDVYFLLDVCSTLSDVTPYVLSFCHERIFNPFSISFSLGEYYCYKIPLGLYIHRDTLLNIIDLNMVYFDIILGMNFLYLCYFSLVFRT